MKEITKDMMAEDIYSSVTSVIENMTKDEIDVVCQSILKAPGGVASIIYMAKTEGWWNQNNEDTCRAILEAPGDRAAAIYFAKKNGWWFQNDEDTCRSILEAPGDKSVIIYLARKAGWWIEPKNQSIA